jgi:hypothetical protein
MPVNTNNTPPEGWVFDARSLGIQPGSYSATLADDNSQAWEKAMVAIDPVTKAGGARWIFGPGEYWFARQLLVSRRVVIEGVSGGDSHRCTWFKFASGAAGGLLMGSIGDPEGSGGGASGSIVRNIIFTGPVPGAGSGVHGVTIHAPCLIEHCTFEQWDDGVHINANSALGQYGNLWRCDQVSAALNAGNGFYVHNADSNAGLAEICSATDNRGWGFWDDSFLGNTYVACHAASNTQGGYRHTGLNARSLYLGCYAEADNHVEVDYPAIWIAGGHDNDAQYRGNGVYLVQNEVLGRQLSFAFKREGNTGDRVGFVNVGGGRNDQFTLSFVRPNVDGGGTLYSSYEIGGPFQKTFSFGSWQEPTHPAFAFGMPGAIMASQPMEIPPQRVAFARGIWIGPNRVEFVQAEPDVVNYAREIWNEGDIALNRGALAGEYIGWKCIAPGTLGTYSEGLTATTDGTDQVTLSGRTTVLKVGDWLILSGSLVRVHEINGTSVKVNHPLPAGGPGLPIAYRAPTFQPWGLLAGGIVDSTATPGNVTQHARKGRCAIPPGAASVVVTNRLVTATSIVTAVLQNVDTQLTHVMAVVPSGGSFTIRGNGPAAGAVNVGWLLAD